MTLLEMLVAIVVSSVIMLGAATMYQTSLANYSVASNVRENVYTSTLTADRINEALRKANPRAIRARPDPVNGQNDVVVYNFPRSMYRSDFTTNSGIIYAFEDRLYSYEKPFARDDAFPFGDDRARPFVALNPSFDFQTMSDTQIRDFMMTSANRRASEVIGFGVSRFRASNNQFTWIGGGSQPLNHGTTWTVEYLQAGR